MAQGNYGTSESPLEEIHSEQVVYVPLTSDPSDREEGSVWFREDKDSGDRVGTFEIQNDDGGNDIDDWPAFAEVDSVDGVVKMFPVQTPNGEAFLPFVEEGGVLDQFRFQHGGTWYGAHNSLAVTPDSEAEHQWNYSAGSGTTVTDQIGSLDAAFNDITWQSGEGVGNVYGELNGTDEFGDLGMASRSAFNHFTEASAGTLFVWVKPAATDSRGAIFATARATVRRHLVFEVNDGDFRTLASDGSQDMWDFRGGSFSADEWTPAALLSDGSTARIRMGSSMTSVASASVSNGSAGDLADNVSIGRYTNEDDNYFTGGIDLSFLDTREWSQSELQDWVSDTEGFYS